VGLPLLNLLEGKQPETQLCPLAMRYYFDLHECGKQIPDEEGRELPNSAAARDVALMEARTIMAAEVQEGRLCLACHIDVLDQDRRPVLKLPFEQALEITGAP
jgi:hypothetical protein